MHKVPQLRHKLKATIHQGYGARYPVIPVKTFCYRFRRIFRRVFFSGDHDTAVFILQCILQLGLQSIEAVKQVVAFRRELVGFEVQLSCIRLIESATYTLNGFTQLIAAIRVAFEHADAERPQLLDNMTAQYTQSFCGMARYQNSFAVRQ